MNIPLIETLNERKKPAVSLFLILTVIFTAIYMILLVTKSAVYTIRIISIILAEISYLITCFFAYDFFLVNKHHWYNGAFVGIIYMNLYLIEMYNLVNYTIIYTILFAILEITFIIIFLWISKNNFSKIFHTLNIVFLSTFSLFILSFVFANYYYYAFGIVRDINDSNFFSLYFTNCKVAMRYFFEFPPDEYLDMITIFQFILGKVYEAVLIGGVASMVVRTVGNMKND